MFAFHRGSLCLFACKILAFSEKLSFRFQTFICKTFVRLQKMLHSQRNCWLTKYLFACKIVHSRETLYRLQNICLLQKFCSHREMLFSLGKHWQTSLAKMLHSLRNCSLAEHVCWQNFCITQEMFLLEKLQETVFACKTFVYLQNICVLSETVHS